MSGTNRTIRWAWCLWWISSISAAASPSRRATLTTYDTEILSVSWQALPECGDAKTLALLVQELLGNEPTPIPSRRANAFLDVSQSLRGYRVVLTFTEDSRVGRRTLNVESCEAAVDASTLVLAVALQPSMRWETALERLTELRTRLSRPPNPKAVGVLPDIEPETPQPEPPITSPTEPIVTAQVVSTTLDARSMRTMPRLPATACDDDNSCEKPDKTNSNVATRIHLAISTVMDTSTLPSWSGGFKAGIGVDYAPVLFDVAGIALLPQDATLPDDSTRGATLQFVGGLARICSAPRSPNPVFFARPCVGTLLAAISGEPFGLHANNRVETYFATTFGVDTELRVQHDVTLVGGIAAIVPLRRVSLVVNGVDTALHRTPIAAQLSFGVKWTP